MGPVAVLDRELRVMHQVDASGRVCVSAKVLHLFDGVLHRGLCRERVQMELALCVVRELDGSDAHVSVVNGQVVDHALDELEQQVPVVVRAVSGVAVTDTAGTVHHDHDVSLEVDTLGWKERKRLYYVKSISNTNDREGKPLWMKTCLHSFTI